MAREAGKGRRKVPPDSPTPRIFGIPINRLIRFAHAGAKLPGTRGPPRLDFRPPLSVTWFSSLLRDRGSREALFTRVLLKKIDYGGGGSTGRLFSLQMCIYVTSCVLSAIWKLASCFARSRKRERFLG